MKKRVAWLLVCFLVLQLGACTKVPASVEPEGAGGSWVRHSVQSSELQFSPLQEGDILAEIETNRGVIQLVLYPRYAPLAVENFRQLAQQGYYNGLPFNRVVKDFVIQGGGAQPPSEDTSIWGHPFASEFSDKLHHYAGALCMAANGGPNTHASQFYIVQSAQGGITAEIVEKMQAVGVRQPVIETYQQAGGAPYLDYQDTVFGQVYGGMDIVDTIANLPVDENNQPKSEVKILSITITTYAAPVVPQSLPASAPSLVAEIPPEGEAAASVPVEVQSLPASIPASLPVEAPPPSPQP